MAALLPHKPPPTAWLLALLPAVCSVPAAGAEPGWLYYGGDQGGRHYSEAAQIDRSNVQDLEVAWTFRSGDMATYGEEMKKTSTQSTPILLPAAAGESLVYCTPFNRVIALDPASGAQRWSFDPQIDHGGDRPFRCRGVSYALEPRTPVGRACRHRLYLSTHDRQLWAIDATDGRPCAGFGEGGRVQLYGDDVKFVVSELAPLRLRLTLKLLPVSFDLVPVHDHTPCLCSLQFGRGAVIDASARWLLLAVKPPAVAVRSTGCR